MAIGPSIVGGHGGHGSHDGHGGHSGHHPVWSDAIRDLVQDLRNAIRDDFDDSWRPPGLFVRSVADGGHENAGSTWLSAFPRGAAPGDGTWRADTVPAAPWPGHHPDAAGRPALFMSGEGAASVRSGGFGAASFGSSTLHGAQSGTEIAAGMIGPTVPAGSGGSPLFAVGSSAGTGLDPGQHGASPAGSGTVPGNPLAGATHGVSLPPVGGHSISLSDGTKITFTSLPPHGGGHAG